MLDLFKIVLFSPGNLIDIGHADHITDQGAVGRENTCHTIWDCICVRRVKTINLFRSVPTFLGTNLFECFVQDVFFFCISQEVKQSFAHKTRVTTLVLIG